MLKEYRVRYALKSAAGTTLTPDPDNEQGILRRVTALRGW